MKRLSLMIAAGVMSLAIGFGVTAALDRPHSDDIAAHTDEHTGAHAVWTSTAATVPELVEEADLIVRVQIDEILPVRHIEQVDQVEGQTFTAIMPFTDVQVRVLEFYKGKTRPTITIMQTGGEVPAVEGQETFTLNMAGDELFIAGDEHVLFLKDISGDSVHASDRELYRVINPAARYTVDGDQVSSPAVHEVSHPENEAPHTEEQTDGTTTTSAPTTLSELEEQIQQASS
ncbi:MAG: hypothetical protein GFH27_549281n347 [Chloroflexi bacterium AL-W]|nr:hypothetical protein [Chloroflexi bacterium AL-N1]NOK66232.1 hypothetical protein [Chloroflexi bacterium AL-N10]NOK73113.1 hypothetical protein [Chloroflexi bacterium AL-N5]NOK80010.1 hypothetical protein [Chloroflexi bacterium AL-W]NOK88134.1 hypothetical protein [Chloroflexi bacterium AL-N15]